MGYDACRSCGNVLADEDDFCGGCGQQARCRACHNVLKPHNRFCTKCGMQVGEGGAAGDIATALPIGLNTLEYREDRTSRSLHAAFTNETASNLAAPLSAALSGRIASSTPRTRAVPVDDRIVIDGEALPPLPAQAGLIDGVRTSAVTASGLSDGLEQVFGIEGERLRLRDLRLKGANKKDTARRLAYLFLYAHKQLGRYKVPLVDLFAVFDEAGADDPNSRTWVRGSSEVLLDGDMIGLRPAGEEKAEAALADFLNPEISHSWTSDTAKPRGPKTSARSTDTTKDKAKPTRRASGSRIDSATISEWVAAWKQRDLTVDGHAVLKGRKGLDRGIFGLWAIQEAVGDSGRVVSSGSLARFLLDAFVIKLDSRSLGRALDGDNNDKVIKVGGTRYQLTPTGITYARQMAGLAAETLRAVPTVTTSSGA